MSEYCPLIISAAYTIIGAELYDFKMIDDNWAPKKDLPDADQHDLEMLKMWNDICDAVRPISIYDLKSNGKKVNLVLAKIPEKDKLGNSLLMGIHLFDRWRKDCSDFIFKAKVTPRLVRLKLHIIKEVTEATNEDIVRRSYSGADNLVRGLTGRAMLDDNLRRLQTDRFKRIIENRSKK